MQTSGLSLADGVLLAHALAAKVAEDKGCRVLFVKGPIAEAFDLRTHRTSSDVDVWVAPDDFHRYLAGLEAVGWRRRELAPAPRILEMHSTTMLHDQWPCDIDVHHMFPGMLADPELVFDDLWRHRTTVEVAGQPVPACDRAGTAVTTALHALRDMQVARNISEFEHLVRALQRDLTLDERDRIRHIATTDGAAQTLAPLLTRLGITPPRPPADPEYELLWQDWELRRRNNTGTSRWVHDLHRAPWRRKPVLLWQAALLPGDSFRRLHPDVGPRARDLWLARAARLGRGILALPGAVSTSWSVAHYNRVARLGQRQR